MRLGNSLLEERLKTPMGWFVRKNHEDDTAQWEISEMRVSAGAADHLLRPRTRGTPSRGGARREPPCLLKTLFAARAQDGAHRQTIVNRESMCFQSFATIDFPKNDLIEREQGREGLGLSPFLAPFILSHRHRPIDALLIMGPWDDARGLRRRESLLEITT